MKFQNHILNIERTDTRRDKPKAICPFDFFKVGGIKRTMFTEIWFQMDAQRKGWMDKLKLCPSDSMGDDNGY